MGGEAPIDLPQIAVVGSQSAGKSSVLENIVGKSFLPRGSGIVTRRPCVIQLHHTQGTEEYGQFLHDTTHKKYTFDEICKEIVAETDRVCGKNKALDSTPINLRIYSPNVINLTLIDLPGATRVPIADQPADIADQITRMILSFISRPNCIILAVSSANTDLANSDAILLSRKVDPNGERTLGVLTKLDLMDRGTNARKLILGEDSDAPKLKLGYVAVINRSQEDIQTKKTIADARKAEMQYFSSQPAYRDLVNRSGTEHLVTRCSQMLIQAIQKSLPQISSELSSLIKAKKAELAALPIDDPASARTLLVEMIVTFTEQFKRMLKGNTDDTKERSRQIKLSGGSRIEGIFQSIYAEEIKAMQTTDDLTPADIQTLIHNVKGLGGGFFTPDEVLLAMIRRQIERLELPALKCCQLVYNELINIVHDTISHVPRLQNYPACIGAVQRVVSSIIQTQYNQTEQQLKTMLKMELYRINFGHPDFIGREGVALVMNEARQAAANGAVRKATDPLEQPALTAPRSSQELSNVALTGEDLSRKLQLLQKKETGQPLTMSEESELTQILAGEKSGRLRLGRSMQRYGSGGAPMPDNTLSRELDEKLRAFQMHMSKQEKAEVDMLLSLTHSYFEIVKKTQHDLVPKAISLLLVGESVEVVVKSLITQLTGDKQVTELMAISEASKEKRKEIEKTLQLLQEAESVLMKDVVNAASFGL